MGDSKQPIFQIIKPDNTISIYADGVVEGVEGEFYVFNCIPFAITPEGLEQFSYKLPYAGSPNMSLGYGSEQLSAPHCFNNSEQTKEATGEK